MEIAHLPGYTQHASVPAEGALESESFQGLEKTSNIGLRSDIVFVAFYRQTRSADDLSTTSVLDALSPMPPAFVAVLDQCLFVSRALSVSLIWRPKLLHASPVSLPGGAERGMFVGGETGDLRSSLQLFTNRRAKLIWLVFMACAITMALIGALGSVAMNWRCESVLQAF